MQFLVYFTEKLIASSLLCCSIFPVLLMGTVQCVILFFATCCVILHGMSLVYKILQLAKKQNDTLINKKSCEKSAEVVSIMESGC